MTLDDPEDQKLVTLARMARTRALASPESAQGAAVRDEDGRTYAAATVHASAVHVDALTGALVAALSSGVRRFEAAVVVGEAGADAGQGVALAAELGAYPVHLCDGDGALVRTIA